MAGPASGWAATWSDLRSSRVPDSALENVRWRGASAFRSLGYYFRIRWHDEDVGALLDHVLGMFAVAPDPREERNPRIPWLPPTYSVLDAGRGAERRYRLVYSDHVLLASAAVDDLLDQLLWHINAETFWQTGEFLLVHAGAVVAPSGAGILLPADSGAGKTTLTAGLVRAGFDYLSDEGGAIDPVGGRLYPYPKPLNLKAGSFSLFPELEERPITRLKDRWLVRAEDIRLGSLAGPSAMRLLVVPCYSPGARTRLVPLAPAQALLTTWGNVWNVNRYRERAVQLLASVLENARSYRLVFSSLDEAVDAIRGAAASGMPPA